MTCLFGPVYFDPSILGKLSEVASIDMNTTFFNLTLRNRSLSFARGATYVFAHLVAIHLESVGTLFPEKDPSAVHDNLALALGHCVQPLAATLVRIPDDIIGNLGPAESEHLLLQGESGEGEL